MSDTQNEVSQEHPDRTVYAIDEAGVWTGQSREVGYFEGRHASEIPSPPPALQDGEFAVWSGSAWTVETSRPQAARAPVSLTVGTLWDRLTDAEWDALDAAMAKEHRRLTGLWKTPTHVMTEGDNLWTVIAGHLDAIVSADRKAELLAG